MIFSGDGLPAKCTRMNGDLELPTCTSDGHGGWVATYPDSTMGGPGGGGFAALFVLVFLAGIAGTIWKVSTARRMARQSGMSEGDATAMTLLTDDGLEATYLASNLRQPQTPSEPAGPTAPVTKGTVEERLRELQGLLDRGLVTQGEYDEARRAILDSL